jgi:hypothetical protein
MAQYSTAFLDENIRVIVTDDHVSDGWRMSAFVALNPAQATAEIRWIEISPLPADDDDDDFLF